MASTIQVRIDDDLKMKCWKNWKVPKIMLRKADVVKRKQYSLI